MPKHTIVNTMLFSKYNSSHSSKTNKTIKRLQGINKIAKACGVGTQAGYKVIGADKSLPAPHAA